MLHPGRPDKENKMRHHALRRARIEARRGRGHGRCPTSYWVCPSTRPQEIVINASPAQVTKRKLGEPFVAHQSRFVDRSHCGSAATRGARRASGKARERTPNGTSFVGGRALARVYPKGARGRCHPALRSPLAGRLGRWRVKWE